MKREMALVLIGILVLGVILAGCTSLPATTPTPRESITNDRQVEKIVFGGTTTVTSTNINDAQYDRLVRVFCLQGLAWISPSGALEPELAESWDVSPDLKKYTFHIYENATWNDGLPLTSADVKFTLENLAKFTPSKKLYTDMIESVETPDAHTVVVNLRKPDANLLYTWDTVKILPEHVYKNAGNITTFNDKSASTGSGPYMFDHFDKEAGLLVFKANDHYWKGTPAVKIIEYRLYKNSDLLNQAFLKGEIDAPASTINYYYVPKILQDQGSGIITAKNGGVSLAIYFNVDKAPYSNRTFREALSYAINYEEMKNLFTAGYGSVPAAGWIPEGSYGYTETRLLSYDVNKSKAMLDSMGMVDKNGDGFRELPDGTKFQGEMIVRSDIADHVRAAEMLKKYFNAVGIDVRIKWADLATFDTLLGSSQEMILSPITYFGINMGSGYGTGILGMSGYAWCRLNDTAYNKMVDELSRTGDAHARLRIGGDLQRYYAENLPMITVYSMDQIQPYNKKYTGWIIGPAKGVMNQKTIMELKAA